MSSWDSYGLTTFRQRVEPRVDAAVGLVLAALSATPPPPPVEIPCDLVIRASARLPAGG
jgi:DNA-binding LacI/PurR family transcriptional regulator